MYCSISVLELRLREAKEQQQKTQGELATQQTQVQQQTELIKRLRRKLLLVSKVSKMSYWHITGLIHWSRYSQVIFVLTSRFHSFSTTSPPPPPFFLSSLSLSHICRYQIFQPADGIPSFEEQQGSFLKRVKCTELSLNILLGWSSSRLVSSDSIFLLKRPELVSHVSSLVFSRLNYCNAFQICEFL